MTFSLELEWALTGDSRWGYQIHMGQAGHPLHTLTRGDSAVGWSTPEEARKEAAAQLRVLADRIEAAELPMAEGGRRMTLEQLDEIEKLAEAATPGPWGVEVDGNMNPSMSWRITRPKTTTSESTARTPYHTLTYRVEDARFLAHLRTWAVPLVKALREAREERDEALNDARLAESRLDEIVELVGSGGDGSAFGSVESLLYDLKERTEERDEARAEIARLKAALDEERALACEEPDPKCSCPGCSYAREKAALKEEQP